MKIIADNITLSFTEDNKLQIMLTTTKKPETLISIQELKGTLAKGNKLDVEMKKHSRKRSNDANAYCFVLCQKIAEVIKNTKENVYKAAIRQVGQFEILPIKNEAVERWIEVWDSKGLGWFAEILEDSKLPGYKKVISYYGSSVYDSREMAVLLDEIANQCKELDIETLPKEEIESLKKGWDYKYKKAI